NMAIIGQLLEAGLDYYCLVDSPENVRALNLYFAERGQNLKVLLEVGVAGGRCGCRTAEQIAVVLDALAAAPALSLAGVETYEGVIHGEDAEQQVRLHLRAVRELCGQLQQQGRFDTDTIILTGAGSAWYDLVMAEFTAVREEGPQNPGQKILPVLRPDRKSTRLNSSHVK